MSSIMLLICRLSLMLYSARVNTVQVSLPELNMRLFDLVQAWIYVGMVVCVCFVVCLLLQ